MQWVQAWRLGPDGRQAVRVRTHADRSRTVEPTTSGAAVTHWLIEAPINAHTHIGDAFLTGRVPQGTLAHLVAPPDGFKHRMLRQANPDQIRAGMQAALGEFAAAGCAAILDFREGGQRGIDLLHEASQRTPSSPRVVTLGRPEQTTDPDAADHLLDTCDGFGLPSIDAPGLPPLEELARRARARHKLFAIHASEDQTGDIEPLLAFEPDLLIHLCQATLKELESVAQSNASVVACPTSNERFSRQSPLPQLVALGIPWAFGTDNAMFGSRSLVREAQQAKAWYPDLPDEEIVRAIQAPHLRQRIGLESVHNAPAVLIPMRKTGDADWNQSQVLPPPSLNPEK